MPQQHLIVHIASSRVKSFFNLETSQSARMLAGSTQQLLLPRKDSHLQKDILLLLSVSHFLLCAKESAESLSVKTKHIDSKTRCTLGNAIPHSQLQNRGKPSLHSICGRYGRKGDLRFTTMWEEVGEMYHFYWTHLTSPHTHVHKHPYKPELKLTTQHAAVHPLHFHSGHAKSDAHPSSL